MLTKIENILRDIFEMGLHKSSNSISLLSGQAGSILFNANYIKYSKIGDDVPEQGMNIQALIENSFLSENLTLATGVSGLWWLCNYLYRLELIDLSDLNFLTSDTAELEAGAFSQLELGNYDYLHGAIGIGYYLLYAENKPSTSFFEKIFHLLENLCAKCAIGYAVPNFDYKTYKSIFDQVNFGVSHGLPSILKFCIQCYREGICRTQSFMMANSIIQFIRIHMNVESSYCFFPSVIGNGIDQPRSRLAWCYGDLMIGYIFYEAALLFCDANLQEISLQILVKTTFRKNQLMTGVQDAGLCHGAAGIAHVYNRLFTLTKMDEFKEAGDFWVNATVNSAVRFDLQWQFEKYNPVTKKKVFAHDVLEGGVGVGLMLLSYLTGDYSWDYCLMLND